MPSHFSPIILFLDALASLDSKLSVSQSVIDVFRLAHLRVFQSYFTCSHWVFLSPNIDSICTYMLVPLSVWITFFLFLFLFVFYIFNIFVCSPLSSPCHFGELLCSTYFQPLSSLSQQYCALSHRNYSQHGDVVKILWFCWILDFVWTGVWWNDKVCSPCLSTSSNK